ncbi:MAG TPA: hypothetical protein VEO95_12235, partial [Chthoniobacteraceae bacterium]|nr:hypothetical protein [Chthoniobacteraceae bacterium]
LVRHSPLHPSLRGWLQQSAMSAIFPESNHYGGRADWLRELARAFPHFLRARFLILEREPRPLDFRFCCRRHLLYTPSVHPQYLSDPHLRDAMCSAAPAGPRRFRVTFLGNRQPPERTARLESCLRELRKTRDVAIAAGYPSERRGGAEALWIEYDAAAGTRGLDPLDYTAALGETECCLRPPGWGRNWAHRTIEACMRGAIPVIEDPELYNLPFADGENCILVAGADWSGAVRRCLASTPAEIARMREDVLRLRESRLRPDVAAIQFRRALLAHAAPERPAH